MIPLPLKIVLMSLLFSYALLFLGLLVAAVSNMVDDWRRYH